MPAFQPTDEQLQALDHFKAGKSLTIVAGAGTGKTATLKILGESTTRRGQYAAFNKAIVQDAKDSMPSNVNASTIHSLAFRALGFRFADRLRASQRMRSMQIARYLNTEPFTVVYKDTKKELAAGYLAGLAMRAVEMFCQSGDDAPQVWHIPYIDGIDEPEGGKRTYANNATVKRHILPAVEKAWTDLQKTDGWLPFRHSHYLKMWERGSPRIATDFLLIDEAQDIAPVAMSIFEQQDHAQRVWVGDSQQEIYQWAGAIDALSQVTTDETSYLTQSFRFGQPIADKANEILKTLEAPLRLKGNPEITSMVCETPRPQAILTRTNGTAVANVLEAQAMGRRVHLVGGGADVVAFARAAGELMEGRGTQHPELACFSTWLEVQEYTSNDELGGELRLMVKLIDEYGVDTIMDALQRMPREESADLIVSTAHKSKGRQWMSVKLANDFPTEMPGPEELRLLYVACTRARRQLDISSVPLLGQMAEKPQQDPLASFDRLYWEQPV